MVKKMSGVAGAWMVVGIHGGKGCPGQGRGAGRCHGSWLAGEGENKRCDGCQPVLGTWGWFLEVAGSPQHPALPSGMGGSRRL